MTLVLTFIHPQYVVQVSDRLTTKFRGGRFLGPHDPLANKTVVFLARDGIMTIGYSGPAYVGLEPTDDWIARQLTGTDHHRLPDGRAAMVGFRQLPARKFNDAIWLLQKAIECEPAFQGGLEVAIAGFRIRRHRLVQTLLAIVRDEDQTSRKGHMRLRTGGDEIGVLGIGAHWELSELTEVVNQYEERGRLPLDPSAVSEVLGRVIAQKSKTTPTVGSDVMAVEIPRWQASSLGAVTLRYKPGGSRLVVLAAGQERVSFDPAFWPWILTPHGMHAPSITTGGKGLSLHHCGWTFQFEAPETSITPGLYFVARSLERPPPPGRVTGT